MQFHVVLKHFIWRHGRTSFLWKVQFVYFFPLWTIPTREDSQSQKAYDTALPWILLCHTVICESTVCNGRWLLQRAFCRCPSISPPYGSLLRCSSAWLLQCSRTWFRQHWQDFNPDLSSSQMLSSAVSCRSWGISHPRQFGVLQPAWADGGSGNPALWPPVTWSGVTWGGSLPACSSRLWSITEPAIGLKINPNIYLMNFTRAVFCCLHWLSVIFAIVFSVIYWLHLVVSFFMLMRCLTLMSSKSTQLFSFNL